MESSHDLQSSCSQRWTNKRIIHYSDQQIMCHLSLFEKSLSLYQSRLMMFKKKHVQKCKYWNFQSSYHCILLNLTLFSFYKLSNFVSFLVDRIHWQVWIAIKGAICKYAMTFLLTFFSVVVNGKPQGRTFPTNLLISI
jgi:hypothetical protein